jgi:hypothetical protein
MIREADEVLTISDVLHDALHEFFNRADLHGREPA